MSDSSDHEPIEPSTAAPARGLSLGGFLALVLTPFLLAGAVIAVAVVTADRDSAPPPGRTYRFEIPAGTAERMERGEVVADVFPEVMRAVVGDTFVVVNLDDATHQLGPIVARAGETASITFYQAGVYQGACTVGEHDEVTITVTEGV